MEEALTSASKCFARKPVPKSWKRWGLYLIESMVLIGLLFLMSRLVPVMPSFVIALLWAVLTFVMTIGHVYRVVVKKTLIMVMPVGLTGDNGKVAAGAVTHNLTDGPFQVLSLF